MKKTLLLSILLLSSCNSTSFPYRLEEKYYTTTLKGLKEITDISEFYNLEKNKESFGIYIYLNGCITCKEFKPILEEYLNLNNIQLYSISYSKIKDTSCSLEKNVEYAPSVALYHNGKIETYLDALKDEHIEYYESIEGFDSWFQTYIDIKKHTKYLI